MCKPTIKCKEIYKEGCTFVKETVYKKGKKPVKKIDVQKVWKDTWWCKQCEGESYPSTNCKQPPHPTTTSRYPPTTPGYSQFGK